MVRVRVQRVQEEMKREISSIIFNDIKDPRVKFVTVTNVEVPNDLRSAKIFVSLYGTDEEKKLSWEGLNKSLGFMRSEIAKRIRLKFVPELSLHIDNSLDYSDHIQQLLNKID